MQSQVPPLPELAVRLQSPLKTGNIRGFDSLEAVQKMEEKKLGAVSFTYTEPTSSIEFTAEFAQLCGRFGLK